MGKAILFLLVVIVAFGCSTKQEQQVGMPNPLLIGRYGGDNPGQYKAALEPLRLYLEKELNTNVKFIFTTDYTAVIQAVQSKKIHAAEFNPFAYIMATQKPGLIPVATLGLDGKPALYKSFIFANPHTGIKTIEDLKAKSKDLTLCFADPASTSGHLIPRAYLISIGLDPDKSFKEVLFAANHAASMLSVKSGKVDVGCSSPDLVYDKLVRENIMKRGDVDVLWTSPGIVNNTIAVREDMGEAFRKKIQDVYLNLRKKDYKAFTSYAKLYYADPSEMNFIVAYDSIYNSIRKIASEVKDLRLLDPK